MPKNIFLRIFYAILSSHGILHQSTYSYTPQQNDIAERKNDHLVKTACT